MADLAKNETTRSLMEIALGFVGVLLIVPVVFTTLKGLFRLRFVRKLTGEALFVGFTALLTHKGFLDAVFGEKGAIGDGLLKPHVDDD